MKNVTIKVAALMLVAVVALSLAACSSGWTSASPDSGGEGGSAASTDDMESAAEAPSYENDESIVADMAEPAAENAASAAGGQGADGSGAGLPDANRKITFSASYTIDTKAYDKDYARIGQLVTEADGYIANEETVAYPYESGGATGRSSYFSLRIPVKGYDSFLGKLEKVGEVSNKTKSSEDLTAEYFDTESRIEILKLRRDRLTAYIKGATKPADIVEFERELSQVLSELDQYEGNKRRLDQLVDYATVNVYLNELITPETIGKDGQPLGERASDAFQISVTNVGEFLQNAAVFLAGAAPVLGLIIVILIVVWLIIRAARRAHATRRAARPETGRETPPRYMNYSQFGAQSPQQQSRPPQPSPPQEPQQGAPKDPQS
jgi:hypothetical protein